MADLYCGNCGAKKKPLAYTTYCPNDCDRLVPRRVEEDYFLPKRKQCPYCKTHDTEPFPDCDAGDWHCNPNGHVWWADGQEA